MQLSKKLASFSAETSWQNRFMVLNSIIQALGETANINIDSNTTNKRIFA